jgi:hypothetical protein
LSLIPTALSSSQPLGAKDVRSVKVIVFGKNTNARYCPLAFCALPTTRPQLLTP